MMRLLATAGGALALLSLVPFASGSPDAFPGTAGSIVFQSNRDGNYELYLANADGSGVKKLLSRPQTDEFNANWSPSGKQIVFQTGPSDGSNFDIWTVNEDGTGAKAVLEGATNDRAPQFCDEQTVVFTRQLSPTSSDVYAIGVDGENLRRLTTGPGTNSFPTCTPKGDRIAFITSREGGNPRIYEMTSAGGNQRPLVAAPSLDPDYSPDGKAIAYVAPDADRNLEVFVMNLATGAVTQRTNVKAPFEYRLPKFMPTYKTAASRSRQGIIGSLLATLKKAGTQEEEVHDVNGESRKVIAQGSGGAPQPAPPEKPQLPPGKCDCASFETTTSRVHMGYKAWSFTIEWKLKCEGDKGLPCTATIVPSGWEANPDMVITRPKVAKPKKGQEAKPLTVTCKGKCGTKKPTTGSVKFSGTAKRVLLSRVRATQGYIFRYQLFCGPGPPERKRLIVQFDDKGRVDKKKSDLNSDGIEDGKQKRRK